MDADIAVLLDEGRAGADSERSDDAAPLAWARFRQIQRLIPLLLTGAANSVVGYSTIFLCLFAGLSGVVSNIVGYAIALTCSFFLNRSYVFGAKGPVSRNEIARFLWVFITAYGVNLCVLLLIQPVLGAASVLAQVIAIGAYTLVFYPLAGIFVFRRGPFGALWARSSRG